MFKKRNGLPSERILTFSEDKEGSIWVGTAGGGLLKITGEKFKVFTTKDGLSLDAIRSLLFDHEGTLWIGTAGGGLNKMKRNNIITYTIRDGLNDNYIWSIDQDIHDNLWVGTGNSGVSVITKKGLKSLTKNEGLSSNNIRTILCDSKGRVWIGSTDSGLTVLDGKKKIYINTLNGLANNHIRALFEDSKGRIWISSNKDLVYYSGNKLFKPSLNGKPILGSSRYITEDKNGNIWFATGNGGLFEYTGNRLFRFTTKDGLSSNDILSIYCEKDNTIWIATGNGFNRFKNNKFSTILFGNSFDNQLILHIIPDNYNNLWLTSYVGLLAVNISELNSFADGKSSQIKSRTFGKDDGMLSTEFNGANQNAGTKTRDGRLWFPTMNGLVMADPEQIFAVNNLAAPNVVLDRFVVDDSVFNINSGKIFIEPGPHKYEFYYAVLSYKNPNGNKYRYKLEGIDNSWIDADNRTVAYYTSLPHGTYTFRVIAANSEGIWNETGRNLTFVILPRFYETWVFLIGSGLLLILLIFGIYKWRTANLNKAKINLQNIVKKQTFQLEEELAERKLKEAKLRESEERLNFYVEGSKDGFWDWDISTDRLGYNFNAVNIFKCEFGKLPTSFAMRNEYIHHEDKEMVCELIDRCLKSDSGFFEAEYRLVTGPEMYQWVFDRGKIVERDIDGRPMRMAGSITDITERKKNEEELLKVKKIESIGLLAGGIAHDFNNLLTAILGNISLIRIKLEKNDNKNLDKLLKNSETASIRARDLTQQLLTFSRGGQPIIRTISIGKLIEECAIFTLRGSKVKSYFDIPDNLWFIDADEGQINQVIQNMIVNALQAMPDGGNIFISAKNKHISRNHIAKYHINPGDYVIITIRDTGQGIQKKDIDKIFDPYFTTKEKGHGLGLSMCYSIIKKHKGHITVESEFGDGTAFIIWLPKSADSKSIDGESETQIKYGSGKILLMDNEEHNRNILEEMLNTLGYDVDTCSKENEVIQKIRNADTEDPYNLVIMDFPAQTASSGLEINQQLSEIDPEVISIISTDDLNNPILSDFSKFGFMDVIIKPYKIEEISRTINNILSGKNDKKRNSN